MHSTTSMDFGKRTSRRAVSSTWKCSNGRPASRTMRSAVCWKSPSVWRRTFDLVTQVTLPGLPLAFRFAGEVAGEARDALGTLRHHHLDGEVSLVAEVLDAASRPVAEGWHDIAQVGQRAFAARIDALAVLAKEDVVD